jgi:formylglycine-generating enzyme required for sulfatase activity
MESQAKKTQDFKINRPPITHPNTLRPMMKIPKFIVPTLLFIPLVALSQDSDIKALKFNKRTHSCSFAGPSVFEPGKSVLIAPSRPEASAALKEIFAAMKLHPTAVECLQADVKTVQTLIVNGKRALLYNPDLIRKALKKNREGWTAKGILAHALAHHLKKHSFEPSPQTKSQELEADRISGLVLARLGASVNQAKAAARTLTAKHSSTYPKKISREFAVDIGWQKTKPNTPTSKETPPKPGAAKLAILNDQLKWNRATKLQQDAIIYAVTKHLGTDYKWIGTNEYQCQGQKCRIATFEHLKSGALLNLIPGGRYQMGSDSGAADEKPVHKTTVKAMLVGKYELRQACWDRVGGEDKRSWTGPDLPVEGASWSEVQNWLGKAGAGLRLPSEAEWEYACRSPISQKSNSKYFWGQKINPAYCWYSDNSGAKTHAVTAHEKQTNGFGLVDTSGSVWEWCQDNWIGNYQSGPANHKPRSTISNPNRVVRGGSWSLDSEEARSANRMSCSPTYRDGVLGFRVVRSLNMNTGNMRAAVKPIAAGQYPKVKALLAEQNYLQAQMLIQKIEQQKPGATKNNAELRSYAQAISQYFNNRWRITLEAIVAQLKANNKQAAYGALKNLKVTGPKDETYYFMVIGKAGQISVLSPQQAQATFKKLVEQIEAQLKRQGGG